MSIRVEKVASVIKQEISSIITREFSSREYGFITVTEVQMTPDLKTAKIYVSILEKGEIRDKTLKMLEDQTRHIRGLLGSQIYLKFTPTIQFFFDETMDHVEHINNIIKKIHQDDKPS
jgi:ribosome-binding factor A